MSAPSPPAPPAPGRWWPGSTGPVPPAGCATGPHPGRRGPVRPLPARRPPPPRPGRPPPGSIGARPRGSRRRSPLPDGAGRALRRAAAVARAGPRRPATPPAPPPGPKPAGWGAMEGVGRGLVPGPSGGHLLDDGPRVWKLEEAGRLRLPPQLEWGGGAGIEVVLEPDGLADHIESEAPRPAVGGVGEAQLGQEGGQGGLVLVQGIGHLALDRPALPQGEREDGVVPGPGLVRHVVMAGRPHRHLLAQA